MCIKQHSWKSILHILYLYRTDALLWMWKVKCAVMHIVAHSSLWYELCWQIYNVVFYNVVQFGCFQLWFIAKKRKHLWQTDDTLEQREGEAIIKYKSGRRSPEVYNTPLPSILYCIAHHISGEKRTVIFISCKKSSTVLLLLFMRVFPCRACCIVMGAVFLQRNVAASTCSSKLQEKHPHLSPSHRGPRSP